MQRLDSPVRRRSRSVATDCGVAVTVLWLLGSSAGCTSQAYASAVRSDQLVRQTLEQDRHPSRGAVIYQRRCADCHGPAALGDAARAVPALAGQRQAYLIKQLADFVELDRNSPEMHHVMSDPALGEPQAMADLAAYLNELPAGAFPETGDGADVELGEAIFQEQCASCHEEDGRGDDDGFVPSLRNQHHSYLARQMRSLASWHRLNVEADLVRYLDSLADEELSGVADYLSRLKGPTRERLKLHDDGTVGD